jgi:phytoene synthase
MDAAMGDVVRTTREPQLGPIRLAWWRERLDELAQSGASPAEPRLEAVARELIPRGVTGHGLAGLEDGRLTLFDQFPCTAETGEAIWLRGNLLFGIGARLRGEGDGRLRSDERVQAAGGLWTLVDAARHCSDAPSRAILLGQARAVARGLGRKRIPVALRPLTMLAALGIRDCARGEPFEPEGTPSRALAMLRHRLGGRLPRP